QTRPFSGMAAQPQNENAGRAATGVGQMSGRSRLLQLGDGAAVERPSRVVGTDGIGTLLAIADGLDARRRHALGDQVLARRVGAPLAEGKVVLARAAFVAMAGDGDRVVGVLLQPFGLAVERRPPVVAYGRHV